ncbi:unnamed protein product [Meganyctiphanes norvegica]|uniref:Protein adenylyltransferase Fic n=1 Tax=Meganyctiphanes norvegica TaxID=48144 RepID=A0AAV2QCY3_MEGNR
MTEKLGSLCSLRKLKYDFSSKLCSRILSGEMNKLTFLLVFSCGVVFAGLVSVLRNSLGGNNVGGDLGVIPAGADIDLMDDGYVAMAKIGAYEGQTALLKKQSTELEDKNAELEAMNTLKAAVDLERRGKPLRAGRLLEHAFSLAPRLPMILIQYGEHLEKHQNNIIKADAMYLRALEISPANSRALQNRRRTRPLVEELDTLMLSRINGKRDELSKIPGSSSALRRIKKEAYYQYVYHTAGIEGNTMTLSQTRMILETRLSVGGKSVMEHNEILGLDSALKFINTTLVNRVGRITVQDILEIHRRVLGHVDPLEAGHFRTTQVFVSDHVPPPPTKLQVLMNNFVAWLNSPHAQRLHPIKYSALAHYKLVYIHPFSDGNGRTARLLMNFLLMQAGYPPVIIRKQDRMMYYNCLNEANEGDTRPFFRFIAHCTEKTVDVYLWATKEHLPEIEQNTEEKMETNQKDTVYDNKLTEDKIYVAGEDDFEDEAKVTVAANLPDMEPTVFNYNYNENYDTIYDDDDNFIKDELDLESDQNWFSDKCNDIKDNLNSDRYSRIIDEDLIYENANSFSRLKNDNAFSFEEVENILERMD